MFLTGKMFSSQAERHSYLLELSNSFSYGMIFKIMPKYKIRKEGNLQLYNNIV